MLGDGELRAQPSEQAGEGDDGERIPRRREKETEARTVGLGEKAHLAVEEREPDPDDAKRKDAAGDSLKQTKVIERAPDEGVGGADQLRNFDLGTLGQDLESDRVEDHRHESGAEERAEQP